MKKIKVLYIQSDNLDKQLKQVLNEFNLELNSNLFSRCPECNFLLKEVEKNQVLDKVPKGVFEQQEIFWVCENCKRYYWQGTHYNKIKTKIEDLFQ